MIVLSVFTLLLIVPGVYAATIYSQSLYAFLDRDLGPLESMKFSKLITGNHKWKCFRFGLAVGGVNILGLLALGIGLLYTIPLTNLAGAHFYQQLEARAIRAGLVAPVPGRDAV